MYHGGEFVSMKSKSQSLKLPDGILSLTALTALEHSFTKKISILVVKSLPLERKKAREWCGFILQEMMITLIVDLKFSIA